MSLLQIYRASLLGLSVLQYGCAVQSHITPPTRSVNEQILLDQSLERSLAGTRLPLVSGKSVGVEINGLTGDKEFIQSALVAWLARQGYRVPGDKQEDYLLRVMVHSFGTNVKDSFFGVPPISGGLFPIALPQLALYKHQEQRALTRLSADLYERKEGRLLTSMSPFEGQTYLRDSTYLFGIKKASSNLSPLPEQ